MSAHSAFSPSASHRILNCPPSLMLCAKAADQSSPYAAEGTSAHELCAYLVEKALVYVASPFAGDEARNAENAVRYCRFAVDSGAIPLAPHLFLPRFMSEANEREVAMFMNMVFLGRCEQLWVFGDRITDGMAAEIAKAKKRRMPIRYFTDDCVEVKDGG